MHWYVKRATVSNSSRWTRQSCGSRTESHRRTMIRGIIIKNRRGRAINTVVAEEEEGAEVMVVVAEEVAEGEEKAVKAVVAYRGLALRHYSIFLIPRRDSKHGTMEAGVHQLRQHQQHKPRWKKIPSQMINPIPTCLLPLSSLLPLYNVHSVNSKERLSQDLLGEQHHHRRCSEGGSLPSEWNGSRIRTNRPMIMMTI